MISCKLFQLTGKTKEEALHNLDEALSLYFEDEPLQRPAKVEHPEIVSLSVKYA